MGSSIRWLILTPLAAVFTVLLFLAMRALISDEFKPQDKGETASFDLQRADNGLYISSVRKCDEKIGSEMEI